MWACSGWSTIGDGGPSKSRPTAAPEDGPTRAAGRRSPSADVNSMAPANHLGPTHGCPGGKSVRRSAQAAGEDDREPVAPHRVDGRGRALDAEVEGELLRGLLQRLRV